MGRALSAFVPAHFCFGMAQAARHVFSPDLGPFVPAAESAAWPLDRAVSAQTSLVAAMTSHSSLDRSVMLPRVWPIGG